MSFYAQDRNGDIWFGYEELNDIFWHHQNADNDMGDLHNDALHELMGPIKVLEEAEFTALYQK